MTVLVIACIGVATVLSSILWMKVHPFLALVLGTLVVLALQPLTTQGQPSVVPVPTTTQESLPNPVGSSTVVTKAKAYETITQRLSSAIADTFKKIGLSILMASIVGVCLLESGAAVRIVQAIQGTFGGKRTLPALSVSSFILAIPVYFDTVFYLLLPLAKAFAKKRGGDYLLSVIAIIVGATMAHSLVPPTPGPLLVASQLGIPIGTMMLAGMIVGSIAATCGYGYGVWCNKHISITMSLNDEGSEPTEAELAAQIRWEPPPISFAFAIFPLAVPAMMIAGGEIAKSLFAEQIAASPSWSRVVDTVSDASFALCIAAAIGLLQLRYQCSRRTDASKAISRWISKSLSDGGMILLLTCAGGAFGSSLKQLGIADAIASHFPAVLTPFGLLWLSFLLTAIIRGAQGSATVAMITTVGVVSPLVQSIELPFNTVYIALAIGCGSKPLAWMNDSGFWQVSAMTGMTTKQTLQTFSAALTIMGVVGFAVTLAGAWLLP